MSAGVTIPLDNIRIRQIDDIDVALTGNVAAPIATLLTGDPAKPIATLLKGDPASPITAQLQGDPQRPVAATVEVLNIPRLSLDDIKDLMTPKIRIRMPNYEQFCVKIFGVEIMSFCLSGEVQAITEPYVPNSYERCEDDCPDLDTRPFPAKTGTHKRSS